MNNIQRRILIIDDNPAIHQDFKKILNSSNTNDEAADLEASIFKTKEIIKEEDPLKNIVIESALQGDEGVKKVQEAIDAKKPYQLAFVDMRIPPGFDGLETIKRICQIDHEIQFVVCTAYSDKTIDDFLQIKEIHDRILIIKKPFDISEIILLASTLTEKWYLGQQAKMKMEELERAVEERTSVLKKTMEEREALKGSMIQNSKMAALGEMAAGIAHEINNPLAIINGSCERLEATIKDEKPNPEKAAQLFGMITGTVDRISKIINGLLTFAHKSPTEEIKTTTVQNLVNDTLLLCSKKFEKSEITIDCKDIDPNISITCNPVQLSQVLLNLLINSRDAIETLPKPRWIKITCSLEKPNKIIISVTDSGNGIPKEVIDKIMQPFFTTKETGKGTGLGLSISLGIIEGHHGTLTIDTTCPNTKFDITLPYNFEPKEV